jgi:hypothetical protein
MERILSSRQARYLRRGLAAAALISLLMWLLGQHYYTSIGLDLEAPHGERVRQTYYRVRWPGNGDLWLGGGERERPASRRLVEPFDPACTWLASPKHLPQPRSTWNHLGWWLVEDPRTDPSDGPTGAPLVWGWWVGVPGWLPVVLFGLWPGWYGGRKLARRLLSCRSPCGRVA